LLYLTKNNKLIKFLKCMRLKCKFGGLNAILGLVLDC